MRTLGSLFRRLEDVGVWRSLAPWLSLDDTLTWSAGSRPSRPIAARGLGSSGYRHVTHFIEPAEARSMADAVRAIRGDGLPAVFLYVFDAPWLLLGRVHAALQEILGIDLEPLADVWAWLIDPRVDAGGWAVHRGWYEDVRGPQGAPSLVNVWVSLSRATLRNACMHLLPLDKDPDWPDRLGAESVQLSSNHAVPSGPGSLLFWNANVLHSGGTCDPACDEPRVSASFTLRRTGWNRCPVQPLPTALSFRTRLDLIATMISTYGARDLPAGASLFDWAAATMTMQRLGSKP